MAWALLAMLLSRSRVRQRLLGMGRLEPKELVRILALRAPLAAAHTWTFAIWNRLWYGHCVEEMLIDRVTVSVRPRVSQKLTPR